jgi:hypothetical protein
MFMSCNRLLTLSGASAPVKNPVAGDRRPPKYHVNVQSLSLYQQ